MIFPIFETLGNKITSLNGDSSYLWRLIPPDLEQIEDKQSYFRSFEESIMANQGNWGKMYHLDNQFWFNSEYELNHPDIQSQHEKSPLLIPIGKIDVQIDLYENYFTLKNKFYQLISIKSFMGQINYRDLECYDFCLMYEKIKISKAKSKLQLNRRMHYSSVLKSIRNIESENSYKESEELLEELITGKGELYKCELFFIISSNTKDELDLKSADLVEYIESIGGKTLIEARGLSFFLNSIIPGVRPSMKRSKLMPSKFMSELAPLTIDRLMDSGLKLVSRRGLDISFDLFSSTATNFNMLITGTSGQGKSMMANKLIQEEFIQGTKGIILDLGNSFKKVAMYNQGTILSERLNPFQFKDPSYLKEFIIAATGEVWTKKDEGYLYSLISEYVLTVHSFDELLNQLDQKINGLKYYFVELEQFFTNDDSKLADLTYCDLTLYRENMKAPLMIYLIEYFKQLDGKKVFVFDECWGLLKNNSEYIATCFRTFRKQNASAVAISQNLDDFSETQTRTSNYSKYLL